jgi:MFS family permease
MDMKKNLFPVFALLFGTLFLFLGNGLHGLLMPVRGAAEHYSTTVLGLLGTAWATGFVLGCLFAQQIVKNIGHVRAFSGFISVTAIIALLTGIMVDPYAWLLLRVVTGFCTAGTSMIIESWLNERATNESRGMIFSLYITITLVGSVGGQMMLPFADTSTPILFMVAGILYCVAMMPTTLSNAATPKPLNTVKLDLRALYRNSPVSCVGILLIGISNGAFGTMGAVFGAQINLSSSHIALMMSLTIFAGALMQLPAGRLSDLMDRRMVLAGLAAVAALSGWALALFQPQTIWLLMVLIAIYGASANALYSITVAHANDFAAPGDFVRVSGGLLLLYGFGTIIGPTIGGPIMAAAGPYSLFAITAVAHVLITIYAVFRSRVRASVPVADRGANFSSVPSGSIMTPEGLVLNPRGSSSQPEGDDGVLQENAA